MIRILAALAGILLLGALITPDHAAAANERLSGNWRGDGQAVDNDGQTYRVRCKMSIGLVSGQRYRLNGKCSSAKGTSSGTGHVNRQNSSTYSGRLRGLETGDSGAVTINKSGSRISVQIHGSLGRITISMKKGG